MNLEELKSKFVEVYKKGEPNLFFSPSRVNLIGEHLDYNGGLVIPAAIKIGTYGAAIRRDDNLLRLSSLNYDIKVEVNIDDIKYDEKHSWANYVKGVIVFMKESGHKVGGIDLLIKGNIPDGAGLSSSASLEMLIAEIMNSYFNKGIIDKVELAKICQRAENDFIGVKCGIMDQFIIGVGKENKCIVLNCDTLDYEYIDCNLKGYSLVIMNTNKKRELYNSKYNQRREECEAALLIIKKYKDITNLCELEVSEFERLKKYIDNLDVQKRAQHVVYENERVKKARKALLTGEALTIGRLLVESHKSLKELYEVTGSELDTIVEAANDYSGCVGARMTGAGFGGCAIALVEENEVTRFIEYVSVTYEKIIGYRAEFYIIEIGDGARKIS